MSRAWSLLYKHAVSKNRDDMRPSADDAVSSPRRSGATLGSSHDDIDAFASSRRVDRLIGERNDTLPAVAQDLVSVPHVQPAILTRAVAALSPCTKLPRCSLAQYETLLETYRGFVVATAVVAIASAWDDGRIAFSPSDQPPFQAEVFGIAGWRTGCAESQLAEAITALNEATAAMGAAQAVLTRRLCPLDVLGNECGLSGTAARVLLFVAAPALWGELVRLYTILGNDAARPVCDEHLLWQLLGSTTSRREIARELDADSPLVGQGVVRVEGRDRPFQRLVADPTVIKRLSGSSVEHDIESGVSRVPATVTLDRFMASTPVIDRAFADLAAAPHERGRVVVRGCNGSGRRTLLAALAQLAGRTLATIDAATLLRENKVGALTELLQRAHLRGWLPCIDGLDALGSDDEASRRAVRAALRAHHGPVTVRLSRHAQPPLEPGYVMIDLPTATITERAEQWKAISGAAGLVIDRVDELATRFPVGPGIIHNVVATVAQATPSEIIPAIESTLRQYLETTIGTVATRVNRLATWSQVVLPASVQDSVAELIARIRHRRTVFDAWGFDQVISSSRGLTALFQGAPGTGKTLLASALANELGLDLYRVDIARVISKWIGETEQNLARVFDAAEQGQALILFDEADALFGRRTDVRTSTDRYANLEINYLLQRLDTFEGIAVLTTNHGTAIDPAFRRRLTCCITLPFPDVEARERLWRAHLPEQLPVSGELDLHDLARRYEMSGGYIRNAALRAAFLAAQEQTALSQFHLERAIRAEFRDGGKQARSESLE
jgi:AAA+ superfamily predicted ATPase